ncbi:MAG: type I-U CRISPR-associated helicase/endonuclease Cas3 [Gammaproteobacteria bacterium]|nr:type I-U CRISPR-associated helicase/endonuclease Cas3 [Gammaproteobacteria bacterium]
MNTKTPIQIDHFTEFYAAVYGQQPFRWQRRLAARACVGDWPRYLKLPTASGKTSCLDIAVFALAFQACRLALHGDAIDMPRRIFFVVDRRIIVNEAFRRAEHLRDKLAQSLETARAPGPLRAVAEWLQQLAHGGPPLDCFELRGGIYRDDAWVRSPLQPTLLTSTVDQVGSRLLFRGYGVSDRALPIHAALAANDAMIIVDEAHCSNPFSQTLNAIARYRDQPLAEGETPRWAQAPLHTPSRLMEMTATPPPQRTGDLFTLEAQDYAADAPLQVRHGCAKPVQLTLSKAAGNNQNQRLARDLVDAAQTLADPAQALADPVDGAPCRKIAIVVNRVDCARETFALLQQRHGARVRLMIGRMRPLDRDALTRELQELFGAGPKTTLDKPHFVVATQCMEVGTDLDFDGMVCQCASLDALRQRFGRLNRLGLAEHARGVVVMASGDLKPKRPDPIYAHALPATWEWLANEARDESVDFGIQALDARLQDLDITVQAQLNITPADAPVLLPAHLDVLCQTGPKPQYEPDIAAFLHGPGRGVAEVQICWRADLAEPAEKMNLTHWARTCDSAVVICPPPHPPNACRYR